MKSIEYDHFLELRKLVAESSEVISSIADSLSAIDVLHALNYLRTEIGRPEMVEDENINLKEVRHPVIELNGIFPNDILFDKIGDFY